MLCKATELLKEETRASCAMPFINCISRKLTGLHTEFADDTMSCSQQPALLAALQISQNSEVAG